MNNAFEIQHHVKKEHHGKGYGKEMLLCLARSSETWIRLVWLGVWERNFKAQNFANI
ncbi:MAG: GNAT family N-acetyltransferase [Streptococcus sp.]